MIYMKSGGSVWNRRSRLGPPVSIPNIIYIFFYFTSGER